MTDQLATSKPLDESPNRRAARPSRRTSAQRRRQALIPRTLTARDANIEEVATSVEDPYEPGTRIAATMNRRTDVLQTEVDAGRITESQFIIGRMLQNMFERSSGSRCGGGGAWNPGDRVDVQKSQQLAIALAVTDAKAIKAMLHRIEIRIGGFDAKLIRQVLGENLSFGDLTMVRGYGADKHATSHFARRFREALEQIDTMFAARGPKTAPIRGEQVEGDPEEEHDAKGVMVPAGRGYTLGSDPAARWTPPASPNWTDTRRRAARSVDEARTERARYRAR